MSVKLLAEHHVELLSLIEAKHTRLSLHLSNYHIVGNHMSRLKILFQLKPPPVLPYRFIFLGGAVVNFILCLLLEVKIKCIPYSNMSK